MKSKLTQIKIDNDIYLFNDFFSYLVPLKLLLNLMQLKFDLQSFHFLLFFTVSL